MNQLLLRAVVVLVEEDADAEANVKITEIAIIGTLPPKCIILNKAVGIARRVRVGQFQLPYDLSAA